VTTAYAATPTPRQRLVRGTTGRLRFDVVDADGEARTPGAPPTLAAVDADGVEVIASAPMTADTAAGPGVYYRDVTAAQAAELGVWVVTVTVDGAAHTFPADVAPARLLTIRELLDHEPGIDHEPDRTRAALLGAELEAEDICGRSFVPRWRRVIVDGSGSSVLELPDVDVRSLLGLDVDGAAWDTTAVVLERDTLRHRSRSFPLGVGNVVVTYLAGLDEPSPDIRRAIARRVRSRLYESTPAHPDRAASVTADGTTWALRDPDPLETGIGWVDAIYARHSARRSIAGGAGDGGGLAPAHGRIDVDLAAGSSLFHRRR
jgi:hypothetical protein